MCIESRRNYSGNGRTTSVTISSFGALFESLKMRCSRRSTLIYAAGEVFDSPSLVSVCNLATQKCPVLVPSISQFEIFIMRFNLGMNDCPNLRFNLLFVMQNKVPKRI